MLTKAEKDAWTAALRNGKYKQGRTFLCRDNEYCCLGVFCELNLPKDKFVGGWILDADGGREQGMQSSLSHPLALKLGSTGLGAFMVTESQFLEVKKMTSEFFPDDQSKLDLQFALQNEVSLSCLNDLGVPFPVIADIIDLIVPCEG